MSLQLSCSSLCLCIILSGCSSPDYMQDFDAAGFQAPISPSAASPANYRTSVGDTLDIFVLEDTSFNGKYVVRPSGDIIIPKLGRISVISMSLAQVEIEIKKILEGTQLKKATVIADPVLRGTETGESLLSGLTIYLSGSVPKAGRKFVPFVGGNNVTAFQAVMDSGGFTSFANKKKAFVLRRDASGSTQRLPVDFAKIEEGKSADVPLQDGDMLVVPQKLFGL